MDVKAIKKLYDDYQACYSVNNTRGKDSIQFVNEGEQWDATAAANRSILNKETLVINSTAKYVNRIKSQNRQIDFSIDVYNKTEGEQGVYESFDLLVKHWFNKKDIQEKIEAAWDKLIDFGYAVAEVNYGYADNETLNLEPTIEIYEDPTEAFFDLKAQLKSRIDGNYFGRVRSLDRNSICDKYPDLVIDDKVKDKENTVIDYWQREHGKAWYVQLKTKVWYRQDLLTDDDFLNNVMRKADGSLIRKRGTKDCIYYYRFINEYCVIDKRPYPTEDMPGVYHAGLTYWTKNGYRTAPYAFFLQSPQKLKNLIDSQVATNLKNSTSAKWLMSNDHITNDKQKDQLRDMNSIEGVLVLGDDPQKVMYYPPTEIPQSMIALMQTSGAEFDAVAGSMNDAQMSDNAIISGIALKEVTNNIQMMNAGLISEHVRFIDSLCRLLVQMLPEIVTEERDFYVKDDSGQMKKIGVNINVGTDLIKNDITSIRNDFLFEVKAGATTTMQKEATIKSLLTTFGINPAMLNAFADKFFKNMDIPDSEEFARRALAFVDPAIIKLGKGEITQEQYWQEQQQKQEKMMQMQQQGQPPSPAEQAIAQAEQEKAAAATRNAQTNEMKAQATIQQAQDKASLDSAQTAHEMGIKNAQQQLAEVNTDLEATQKMIDIQRLGNEENADTN